ncbi:MAG: hypothetical protein LBI87_07645 [Candidatus Accumulibacter sp.]|jgi:hypothetical protein|nr:hypothetical protein [Accumulibacter sp.]
MMVEQNGQQKNIQIAVAIHYWTRHFAVLSPLPLIDEIVGGWQSKKPCREKGRVIVDVKIRLTGRFGLKNQGA